MNGVGPYGARHTLKKSYSAQKNMWAHTELATIKCLHRKMKYLNN